MAYATTDIILWAKLSQSLAAIGESKKKALNNGNFDEDLHTKLYVERKSLEWEYAQDPTSSNLYEMGNWVYALCGSYVFQAQQLAQNISPVNPETIPDPLDFIVSGVTPVATGQTSVILTDFIGYNIQFIRGGIYQYTTDPGDGGSWFTWNRFTGTFTISQAAGAGEPFRIVPTIFNE